MTEYKINFLNTTALRIYKYFFYLFLVLLLSIFTSRGRMGGDQLEAYGLALDFYNYTGDINSFISSKNLLILDLRWFWASIDFIFIKLFPSNINLIICTLLPVIFSWIALFQTYKYANVYLRNKYKAIAFSLFIFFGSCLIVGFNGITLETLAFLLLLNRTLLSYKKFTGKPALYFLIDSCLISFKPFYALIPIILNFYEFGFLNKNNYKSYIALIFSFFPWLIIHSFISISSISFFEDTFARTSISNYLLNLYNFNFSFGMGLVWNYFSLILLIFFGVTNKKVMFFKLLCMFSLELFLSFFPYWHGGLTGSRYIYPLIAIWIPEMLRGFENLCHLVFLVKKPSVFRSLIPYGLVIIVILFLPILEYKNTSIYEYQNSTVYTNKPVGVIETQYNYFPVNDVLFNPIIFSNRILYYNIFNIESIKLVSQSSNTRLADIYPNTILMRAYFASKNINKMNYLRGNLPDIVTRNIIFIGILSKLLITLFYFLIIFIQIYVLSRLRK